MTNLLIVLLSFLPTYTIEIRNPPIRSELVVVTGYSSEVGQTDDSPEITASQKRVRVGFIACPRKLKFGTIVEIEGKEYVCEDRMHGRFDNRYDIWFPSTVEAREWGIKTLEVKIK